MSYAIQLDLFEKNDDVSILFRELGKINEKQDTLRKAIFARHGDLFKLYMTQQEELLHIKTFLVHHCGAKLYELIPPVIEKPKRGRKKKSVYG